MTDVYCVNAFIHEDNGGNPAGVVLNADALTRQQMQEIATLVGYSETAFVSSDKSCDFHVRFFTPTEEVDFCGHATLATFSLMFQQKILTSGRYIQRTGAGELAVNIKNTGEIEMDQQLPRFLGQFSTVEIASLLNILPQDISSTNCPPGVVSTGLADLIIPVNAGVLASITPNQAAISAFCQAQQIVGFHLFELADKNSEISAYCRNFAPLVGIPEESATGSASGALACYLHKHQLTTATDFIFHQGIEMGKTSALSATLTITNNNITAVRVAGFAKIINLRQVPAI